MTRAEAATLEHVTQDRTWQWTRVFRGDLLSEIETGVSSTAWDDQGVTWFSRIASREGVTR